MNKNIKPAVIGLTTTLIMPITSLAYEQISNNANEMVPESSNLQRAVTTLNKSGVVKGVASNDYLNIRTSATSSSTSIGKLYNGDSLVITGQDGDWYRIEANGKTGYVYGSYVNITGDITYKQTTDNLNFRTGASTSYSSMGLIPKGTTVQVLSISNGWAKVYYSGKIGYCSNTYLTNATSTDSSTSGSTTTSGTSINKEGQVINVASNDKLNVRTQPNTQGAIVTSLANGTKVQVIEQDTKTKWYKISYNKTTGYVSNSYIKLIESSTSNPSIVGTKQTTDNLNFRTGPSTNYSIIATIPKGTAVECYAESTNGWVKIKYNGKDGYVNSSYLTTNSSSSNTTSTVKKVTTTGVNMRTGASTSYSVIKVLASNTVVDVISTSGNWDKVSVGGQIGYVNNSYLKTYSENNNSSSNLPSSKPLYSKVKVVVDAGHGGTDPGAVANGLKEKDIVLSIASKVNSNLKSLGFQTIMTRSTDTYITLSNRYTIANNNNADIFVSVHANSGASSASGIETLYKNYKTLADNIQSGMINETGAKNRGLKYRSDLAVLNGTKMPSSLVEVGFVSNASEAIQINNNSYQNKLATGITKGIVKYTDNNIKK